MSSRHPSDPYETLAVSRSAAMEEIRTSYRQLAMKYHPDRNPGDPAAEESFKEISQAYDILIDPDKRAAYDRYGYAAFQGPGGGPGAGFHDPFDLFREVFGSGGGGIFEHFFGGSGGGANQARGADLRYDLEIKLEEAAPASKRKSKSARQAAARPAGGPGGDRARTFTLARRAAGAGR